VVEKGAEQAASRIRSPPQGDRKGPHPAPHRPRPYNEVIITHIFLGSLVERNYRAELVHKRYHAKCLVTSVHRNAPKDMGNDDIIVRAGEVWSGVGTLAVALESQHAPPRGYTTLTERGGNPCGRP